MAYARIGVRSLEGLIGRVDLLEAREPETDKQRHLDLSRLIWKDTKAQGKAEFCQQPTNPIISIKG